MTAALPTPRAGRESRGVSRGLWRARRACARPSLRPTFRDDRLSLLLFLGKNPLRRKVLQELHGLEDGIAGEVLFPRHGGT